MASGSELTVSGVIGDGGTPYGLTTSDTGTLAISGTSSYTGVTIVNGGNLLIDGNSSSSSGFTVNSGGSLVGGVSGGGTAVSGVSVNSGGTVAPGFGGATAELTAAGNVSFASGSTYSAVLGGATAGAQYDQLNVNGTVDLNSDAGLGATLTLALTNGYVPVPGTTYTIITSTGVLSNTFDGDADGSTVMAGGYAFQINYQASAVVLMALPRIDTWTGGDGTGNWSVSPQLAGRHHPSDLRFPGLPRRHVPDDPQQRPHHRHRIHLDRDRRRRPQLYGQPDRARFRDHGRL